MQDAMKTRKQSDKVLSGIFGLKASHITGIIISSYLTVILMGIGIKEQTISWIVASIGLTYPVISMVSGIISDHIGRYKVYVMGKVFCCFFIFLALFFTHSKILAVCLYMTEAVENGIEPLISAVATDNSTKSNRMKIFTWLSLGGSVGMMVISLVSAYLMNFNMQIYLLVLVVFDFLSVYFMHGLTISEEHEEKKRTEITDTKNSENQKKESFIRIIIKNKYLVIFSVILIVFSILYSQLNYSFAIKLKKLYGEQIENRFGILLSVYYLATILFMIYYNKRDSKKSCVDNLITAGFIYTICMFLITLSNHIVILGVSLGFWAVAQMMVTINNSVFVAENCSKDNVGVMTVFFSIISSSGVVIGPVVSGLVIKEGGITINWAVMTVLGGVGTITMYLLRDKYKNGGLK